MSFLDLSEVSVGDVFKSTMFKEVSYTILDVNYELGTIAFRNNDIGGTSNNCKWGNLTLGNGLYFTSTKTIVIDLAD